MQVGYTAEDNCPDDGTDRTDNILWDEEQGHKDNGEESDGEWTGEIVPRHFEAIWQKVTGFTVFPMSHHCQGVYQDIHVI